MTNDVIGKAILMREKKGKGGVFNVSLFACCINQH